MVDLPQRRRLHHEVPAWVTRGALFFVTINAAERGSTVLTQGKRPEALIASAIHYHTAGTWWLQLLVVMPDHLHALLAVPEGLRLEKVISAWKSYQTKRLGIQWQSGFFDHRLRDDESLEAKARYIRMNPVRAGLVARPEKWPHTWSPMQDQGEPSG